MERFHFGAGPEGCTVAKLNQVSSERAAGLIQGAQDTLGHLQMQYSDDRVEFWALALAWEAARLAWYVVSDDATSVNEKLSLVETAFKDFHRTWQLKESHDQADR